MKYFKCLALNKVKWTGSVITSDPPFEDGNVRFKTVPNRKLCLIKYELDINVFVSFTGFHFCGFLFIRNNGETYKNKTIFKSKKTTVSSTFLIRFRF